MNIEVADTRVATRVATTATRKIAGSKAEPDPVPLRNAEDMKSDYDENGFTDLVSCDNSEVDAMMWLTEARSSRTAERRNASCSHWRAGEARRVIE